MSEFILRRRVPLARLFAACVFVGLLLPFLMGRAGALSAQDPGKKPRIEEEEEDPKANPPKKKASKEEKGPKGKQPNKRMPVEEEEEDSGPKPERKVIRVEDEPKTKPPSKPAVPQPQAADLRALAKDAKLHPVILKLYADMAVPHDVITLEPKTRRRTVDSIEPLPHFYGVKPEFRRVLVVRPFDENWKLLKSYQVRAGGVQSLLPYEQVAEARIDEFLKITPDKELSRSEMLAAAHQVLVSVGRFHRSARERGRREGEEWDLVEKELKNKLFDVELLQLEDLLDANDWDNGYRKAKDLFDLYPSDDCQRRLAKALGDYVEKQSPQGGLTPQKVREIQARLKQLEELNPNGAAAQKLEGALKSDAQKCFDRAKDLYKKPDRKAEALEELKRARALWPQLPGLEDSYLQWLGEYPILRVGVRTLPLNMAPGVAWTESERQAVELLFEGLLKVRPDGSSDDYEQCLADGRPRQIRLGRQFHITRNACWSDGTSMKATDVVRTVRYLKNKDMPGYTPSWAELMDDVTTGRDNSRVSLTLKHGYLDPCSLMTFKVLPNLDVKLYREEFAHKPVGSGPYIYKGVVTDPKTRRQVAIFVANPYYASRPGKVNLPRIREIRFIATDDPVTDFENDVIDLLLPEAYAGMTEPDKLADVPKVKVLGPLASRRIYFLAINHRKPMFEKNVPLRRALALVIDRQKILDDCFGKVKGNAPLNGPYPADSWASKDNLPSLDDRNKGKSALTPAAKDKIKGELTIKFPSDDDRARRAVGYICTQITNELGTRISPEAVDPSKLHNMVEETHDYQLAYYHYDFPSAAFWLWPLFDPRGCDSGQGNYLGYTNDGQLESKFRQVMTRRQFSEVVRLTHDIRILMQEHMPLIPLWQLAEHVAIRDGYETGPIDPLLVLGDVEHWRRKTR
jgi:ABC-type oligopeptide transport system substrate-binding subunit